MVIGEFTEIGSLYRERNTRLCPRLIEIQLLHTLTKPFKCTKYD
jgi:hypothetical protein